MKSLVDFVNGTIDELKRITWPSRKETTRLTGYVVGVSVFVGLFVTGFDYLFKEAIASLLIK